MSAYNNSFTLCILVCAIAYVAGLRCWTCENAKSRKECLKTGFSKQCRYLEKSCQTEVRLSEGMNLLIKTGCKQPGACNTNEIQNPRRAWYPVQCNGNIWNSVCRCCCEFNNCNKKNIMCEQSQQNAPGELIDSDPRQDPLNDEVPTIPEKEPTCGELPADPIHGAKSCRGRGELGTSCTFICENGYDLIGASSIKCRNTPSEPTWSDEVPTCVEEVFCPDLGNFRHGEIDCSESDLKVGTVCHFQCAEDGYELMPQNRTQIECIKEGTKARWNKRKPCCSTHCPPEAKKDVVIVMDSSSSISKKEWNRMKQFVVDVTGNFDVSPNGVQFAVYRFFRTVDIKNQVHFGDFAGDSKGLTQAVLDMPKYGGGTYIARALRHARDNVLKTRNREDVKDLIWVLTDGRSDDDTEEVAQEIRDLGVEIIALGISRKGKHVFEDELLKIAGHEDNVLDVKDGIDSLTKDLVDRIVGKFCESSCHDE